MRPQNEDPREIVRRANTRKTIIPNCECAMLKQLVNAHVVFVNVGCTYSASLEVLLIDNSADHQLSVPS
jgi:hypothetical protein